MATKHVLPRIPSGEDDLYIPLRETAGLLDDIVNEVEALDLVPELGTVEQRLNAAISCLNKLITAIGGK